MLLLLFQNNMLIFLIIGIIVFIVLSQTNIFTPSLIIDEGFITKFIPLINKVKNSHPYNVPTPLILGIIKQESGILYRTKTNKEIIGDVLLTNKAYGYMQVRLPALTDVNNSFNLGLSIEDIQRDEENNLIAGIGYLQLCRNSAILQNANDVNKSTAQKYNAGVNTLEDSSRGRQYASAVIDFNNSFNEFIA